MSQHVWVRFTVGVLWRSRAREEVAELLRQASASADPASNVIEEAVVIADRAVHRACEAAAEKAKGARIRPK
jgi:hypothetical protein